MEEELTTPEEVSATVCEGPFPHLIIDNFYNEDELNLIWQELNFYTLPNKLLTPKKYGGIPSQTKSKGLVLDSLYKNYVDSGKRKSNWFKKYFLIHPKTGIMSEKYNLDFFKENNQHIAYWCHKVGDDDFWQIWLKLN